MSLAPEDIILPLIHVKGLLRTAISDTKLSKYLLISHQQAERIAFIVDQLLAHSHVVAAASLSRGLQRFATAKSPRAENARLAPSLYNTGTIAQELYAPGSEHSLVIEGSSQKRHGLNRMWAMQSLSKRTPWGTMEAEIYLMGDCLYSEPLGFRLRFSPDRQLPNIGMIVDYASHHIKSLVRLDYPLSMPDQPPSDISLGIDYETQRRLVYILVEFLHLWVILVSPMTQIRHELSGCTESPKIWIEHNSLIIKSLAAVDCGPFLSLRRLHALRIWETIDFESHPVGLLADMFEWYFESLEQLSGGFPTDARFETSKGISDSSSQIAA